MALVLSVLVSETLTLVTPTGVIRLKVCGARTGKARIALDAPDDVLALRHDLVLQLSESPESVPLHTLWLRWRTCQDLSTALRACGVSRSAVDTNRQATRAYAHANPQTIGRVIDRSA